MTAILWPLVVLLLGSGALAFGFKWLAQRNETAALRSVLDLQRSDSVDFSTRAVELATAAQVATKDLDDRLKRLELAQEFRT